MRKAVLYIAMSLDGFIADSRGGVDWLNGQGEDSENVDTYSEFIKGIDTVLMGWKTYHQVTAELSPGQWIYGGLQTYVFTHGSRVSTEEICFTDEEPAALLRRLKMKSGKDIWVCGGADLAGQLMRADLIDRYHIAVIPTLLGSGVRLFGELPEERKLMLVGTQSYNGIVELVYERRSVDCTESLADDGVVDLAELGRL